MRRGWLWVLVVGCLTAGRLPAQAPQPAQVPQLPQPPASDQAEAKLPPSADAPAGMTLPPPSALFQPDGVAPYHVWARVDYLLWWVKSAPLPVPLVTTGNPSVGFSANPANTVNTAGAIGQPGTRVLLGDATLPFNPASGVRSVLGGWIDDDQRFGVEGGAFLLARQVNHFSVASDSAGNPPLYFPIFSAIAGAERAIPIADPLRLFSGDVDVNSTMQLWGAEANGLFAVYRDGGLVWTLLAGFRYVDLRENLHIRNTTTDLAFGNVTTLHDAFGTKNQFYGGQVGSRLAVQFDRLWLDVTGKLALGSTRQLVTVQGDITQTGANLLVPPGPGTFPGGLFAQSTNIGDHSASPFMVPFTTVATLEFRIGYAITSWMRAFAGYDLLYWNNVVRPGDQISHAVNLTQNAILDPNGVGRLVGPALPAVLFNRNDFWAQGISVGIECRY